MNQILRRQTSRSHYGSKVPAVTVTVFKYRNKIGKIVVKAVPYSVTYFSSFPSIFSLYYHYFLLYFPNHFTFQLNFFPYFPYHFTIFFRIFNIFSLFNLGFFRILMSHRNAVTIDTVCLNIFVSCVLSFSWSLLFPYVFLGVFCF